MSVNEVLTTVLTSPSPEGLRQLRGVLLQVGLPPTAETWQVMDKFYGFLVELTAKSTARQYSHFASLLDIGAVGGIVVGNLLTTESASNLWRKLLTGGISESLMVWAARQYVKAWEEEMTAVYEMIGWYLHQELWNLSKKLQPELEAVNRNQLIELLLAPIHQTEAQGIVKAALIGRLFQILLLVHLNVDLTLQKETVHQKASLFAQASLATWVSKSAITSSVLMPSAWPSKLSKRRWRSEAAATADTSSKLTL